MRCILCNKQFKNISALASHLISHKISSRNYYDRYLRNYARNEGFCLICGKETKSYGLRGYSKHCSNKCQRITRVRLSRSDTVNKKRNKTLKQKYDITNPWQMEKIIEKTHSPEIIKKQLYTRIKNNTKSLKHNKPIFNYWYYKINLFEEVRRSSEDTDILEVRCKKCNKWFVPNPVSLRNRIYAINGKYTGEYNLYCSDDCKQTCSIYRQINYQRNQNPNSDRPWHSEWSLEVKRIANYECEICGSRKSLEAHHIEPVKLRPDLQADIDNGICLCKNCHGKYGHKDECSTGNLARMIC